MIEQVPVKHFEVSSLCGCWNTRPVNVKLMPAKDSLPTWDATAGRRSSHVGRALASMARLLLIVIEQATLGWDVAPNTPLVWTTASFRPNALAVYFGVGGCLIAMKRQKEAAVCRVDYFLPHRGVPAELRQRFLLHAGLW